MHRFTDHAKERFVERRPDLFRPGTDPPHRDRVYDLATESYSRSLPASREEAEAFMGQRMRRIGNIFYRMDDVGIWIVSWAPSAPEVVLTYIVPGEDVEVSLHVEGMTGAVSF